MKRSSIYFIHQDRKGSGCVLTHPNLGSVNTFAYVSSSVILSLAAFINHQFLHLYAPNSTNRKFEFSYKPSKFPNLSVFLHPAHQDWVKLLCNCVDQDNVVRDGSDMHIRVYVDEEYMEQLLRHGFKARKVEGQVTWDHLKEGLSKCIPQQRRKILFISCSYYDNDRPRIFLNALYMGLFYNNQRWRYFNLFEDGVPDAKEFETASVIIIPGSSLSVYCGKPQLGTLASAIKTAFAKSPDLKFLGVCFGHQFIANIFGGKSNKAKIGTYLNAVISINQESIEFAKLDYLNCLKSYKKLQVSEFHSDQLDELPKDYLVVADSTNCRHEIVVCRDGRSMGMQCHPEYSSAFLHYFNVRMKNYAKKLTDKEIEDMEAQKYVEIDDGGEVVRQLVRDFIDSSPKRDSHL